MPGVATYGARVASARRTASAPGRVTLLGEHTDYNAGLALAVATEQRTTVVLTERDDGEVQVRSEALGDGRSALSQPSGAPFVVLAAALVATAGLDGATLGVRSDLPVGAGLSSSAAYVVAVALAAGLEGDDVAVASACQAAERAAGADVGLLDQLVALRAHPGAAVDLDFATLTTTTLPLPAGIGLSVVDSGTRRAVGASAYAQRREECARAARALGPLGRARIVDVVRLADPVLRRRARHVVTECARVVAARAALRAGDLLGFGSLLDEGHASLRDDFDASTPVVEAARDAVRRLPGVVGVRLTGGGFGGCLLVAHDPAAALPVGGFRTRLRGGAGATVSPSR